MRGGLLLKVAALTAAASVSAALAAPALAYNIISAPTGNQVITYAGAGSTTFQTIIQMAAGATANPFVIENSTPTPVFSVTPSGGLIMAGPLKIGGGTQISKFYSMTHALVIGAISAHSCVVRAFNPLIPGAAVGDTVMATPQGNGSTPIEITGDVSWSSYVGFGGKIAIKACNVSTANVNLSSSENWVVDYIQH